MNAEDLLAEATTGGMDPTHLAVAFGLGLIGTGFFLYGKKASRPVPLIAGLLLCVVPCFVPNLWVLTTVGVVLCGLPVAVKV